jgi:hypothetical protein
MSRWIIEQCTTDYMDETGLIPWAVCNLDDPDHGQETFNTKAQAMAYKKEQENS